MLDGFRKINLGTDRTTVSTTRNFLGSYRLIRLIRGGQTCNVWEATNDTDSDHVALKVLLEEHRSNRGEVEQLKHEAKVGQVMEHPQVIKIFDFVNHADAPFIVMQLFNARNLKQELRDNPDYVAINIPEIVEQCAAGLQYLHSQGWIHCDVKPDNFLVNEQGSVKLIDFSIAQPARARAGGFLAFFGARGKVQGTRSYMSPEQIRGKTLSEASDVYGFGCVLHELLTGRPPFSGVNPNDLLSKHLRAIPPSIQAVNRNVSDKFAALVARMLSKDEKKRPQTLDDFQKELKEISIYKPGMRPKSG